MKSSSTGRGTATPDDRSADAAFAEFRRSGQPAAMAELFDRAAPGLLLFARRLCGGDAARAEVRVDASMSISLVLEPVAETVVVLRNEVDLSSVTGWADHLPILAGGRVFPMESELDPGTYVYQGLPDKDLNLQLPTLGLLPQEIQAGAVNELELPETGSVRFEIEAPPGFVSFEVEHVESGARLVRNWPGNGGVLTRDLTPFRVGTYTASLLVTDEEAPTWRAKPVGTVEFEVWPGRRTKVRLVHP